MDGLIMSLLKARLLAALCLGTQLIAGNSLLDEGYRHFYNLEYDEAVADFKKAVAQQPDVPDLHNHLAEAIVFREMYRDGALESELVTGNNSWLRRAKLNPAPETERRFLAEIQQALDLERSRLRRNSNDTAALYAMGITYGLRANYLFLVKKAWRDSLRDATTARKLHSRVSELEPSNVDARLVQGIHDYIVGSLPAFYRMLGFLIGFRGDKERGIGTIEAVAGHGRLNRTDARIFLAALYRREHQPAKALSVLQQLVREFPRNYLLRFAESEMHAALGDGKRAIGGIQEMAELKSRGEPGFTRIPWAMIYYHLGTIQFWSNELDEALSNMKRVTAEASEVDLNTGVLAWMRIGQIYDLTNRRSLAVEAYRKAAAFAPGADAARESLRYIASPYRRDKS